MEVNNDEKSIDISSRKVVTMRDVQEAVDMAFYMAGDHFLYTNAAGKTFDTNAIATNVLANSAGGSCCASMSCWVAGPAGSGSCRGSIRG